MGAIPASHHALVSLTIFPLSQAARCCLLLTLTFFFCFLPYKPHSQVVLLPNTFFVGDHADSYPLKSSSHSSMLATQWPRGVGFMTAVSPSPMGGGSFAAPAPAPPLPQLCNAPATPMHAGGAVPGGSASASPMRGVHVGATSQGGSAVSASSVTTSPHDGGWSSDGGAGAKSPVSPSPSRSRSSVGSISATAISDADTRAGAADAQAAAAASMLPSAGAPNMMTVYVKPSDRTPICLDPICFEPV